MQRYKLFCKKHILIVDNDKPISSRYNIHEGLTEHLLVTCDTLEEVRWEKILLQEQYYKVVQTIFPGIDIKRLRKNNHFFLTINFLGMYDILENLFVKYPILRNYDYRIEFPTHE
jgi:hypothetical protein